MSDTIRMTKAEWRAKGLSLFGDDFLLWRFVCPSCGHVQTAMDFLRFKDQGATPNTVYFNCIGRYDGHMDVPMYTTPGPCNYTSGGLLNISPVLVTDEEFRFEQRVFAFDMGCAGIAAAARDAALALEGVS